MAACASCRAEARAALGRGPARAGLAGILDGILTAAATEAAATAAAAAVDDGLLFPVTTIVLPLAIVVVVSGSELSKGGTPLVVDAGSGSAKGSGAENTPRRDASSDSGAD